MNLRDLKYLVALSDYSHFGKAAAACHVSQPALSMQIKKLENFLGVQLLERNNKKVFLTAIGKEIVLEAREVLLRIDRIRQLADRTRDPFSGELQLGVIPTLAPYLLPHLMPGLTKVYPKLTIFLAEETTSGLLQKLSQGKLDAALVSLPLIDSHYFALPLFEEEFVLAVPGNHALAKRKHLRYSDLENNILLLLEEGHCLRDQALSLCQKMHVSESSRFRATSLETLRHMIVAHAGITLMPRLACKNNDALSYLPFQAPRPSRTIGMIWRKSASKGKLLENIVLQIRKLLGKTKLVRIINTPIICR